MIGLTAQRERAVSRAREEVPSGEPDQVRAYLTRECRDRGFDAAVKKALLESKPVPRETVTRMVGPALGPVLGPQGRDAAPHGEVIALARGAIIPADWTSFSLVDFWRGGSWSLRPH